MKINKKMLAVFLCILTLFSGCWNYVGLDELDIITGMAIDRPDPEGPYHITFEMIDTHSQDNGSSNVKYIEVTGTNIFDAIRNAKRRLSDKPYGGNMDVLIISHQLAEDEGIMYLIENLLRDPEARETLSVVISQQKTAKEIFFSEGLDTRMISIEINQSLKEDNTNTLSTYNSQLYTVYNQLKGEGTNLTLPVVHCVSNILEDSNPVSEETDSSSGEGGGEEKDEEEEKSSPPSGSSPEDVEGITVETNGIAYFKEDKLAGFLSPEETKYFLFIKNEVKGGDFSIPNEEGDLRISFEITKNHTKSQLNYSEGVITLTLDLTTHINAVELGEDIDFMNPEERELLKERCESYLKDQIENLFIKTQQEIGFDIYSLGNTFYKTNLPQWNILKTDWDNVFKNMKIEVNATVLISNTGILKSY